MSEDRDVRRLLAPMVERTVDLEGGPFRVDRAATLARMARANRLPRRGWLGTFALVAAGAGALVLGARVWQGQREGRSDAPASLDVVVVEGNATLIRGARLERVSAARGAHVIPDGELETAPASKARVSAAAGLEIELASETRVALGGLHAKSSRVNLLGGAIRCVVAPRTQAYAFQVVTPDVTVVDLGTVFTVSLEGPTRGTRVSVEEGEVLVRHALGETRVQAPGSWSAAAPSRPAAAPTTKTPGPGAKTVGAVATTETTLDREARLLRQGLAAERQGRFSEAQSALAQLLRRYPGSPLAPDARAALARVEAAARR